MKRADQCRDCSREARQGKVLCSVCHEKARARQQNWLSTKAWMRAINHRWRVYGVSSEQFIDMLFDQDGRCAMCGEFFLEIPDIDHSHKTGRVRSLLCHRCNTGFGYFDDDEFRQNAETYRQRVQNGEF